MRRTRPLSDVEKVYEMLKPKPKPLLVGERSLVRHGELGYFSPNTMSKKMRYFFLFTDCFLLTKRMSQAKFQLKIYIHLRGSIKLVTLSGSPTYEFRLLVAEKGTVKKRKERRIILFGKSEEHKQAWLKDLQYCLWGANGKRGPDPSKSAPQDVSYDSDDEPAPAQKKAPPKEEDDHSYGSSSGDEKDVEPEGAKGGGDPLIIFDPFGEDPSRRGQYPTGDPYGLGFNPTLHQGLDARGQAIPKGVMLPPLPGGASTAPPYGGMVDPMAGYGAGVPPYGYPGFNPVLAGTTGAYSSGGAYLPGGGVSALSTDSIDKSALYGAAAGTGGAVGSLFNTEGDKAGEGVDLDAIAQKELQEATRLIEALAQELAARHRNVKPEQAAPDTPLTWEHVADAILDGTGAIARAASALLKATAAAQKERVDSDVSASRKQGSVYHADPVWANGLISAGRYVVASTQLLVSTANAAVQGQAKEEALVAASQAVGIATAQLVAAERAKGNIRGQAHAQLEEAAGGIKRATTQLFEAAKLQTKAVQQAEPPKPVDQKFTPTEKQLAELEAKTKILQLEEETRKAREELARLRKEDYQGKKDPTKGNKN